MISIYCSRNWSSFHLILLGCFRGKLFIGFTSVIANCLFSSSNWADSTASLKVLGLQLTAKFLSEGDNTSRNFARFVWSTVGAISAVLSAYVIHSKIMSTSYVRNFHKKRSDRFTWRLPSV